jgi:hypothetical protein
LRREGSQLPRITEVRIRVRSTDVDAQSITNSREELDLGGDAVLSAEVEHSLGDTDATIMEPANDRRAPIDQVEAARERLEVCGSDVAK